MITKELQDKFQLFANKLQERLVSKYGDKEVSVNIKVDTIGQFYVTITAQGKTDSYVIYQNQIDGKYYFIRNWNGVV